MFAINIENLKRLEYQILFTVRVAMNMKKIFKEEESIEISTILGLSNNIEEYQKICNHV